LTVPPLRVVPESTYLKTKKPIQTAGSYVLDVLLPPISSVTLIYEYEAGNRRLMLL
jgi:hypothetical protein